MFYNDDDVNFLRDTPSTISDATNFKHDEVDKDLSNESDGKADSDEDFVPEKTDHQPQKSEVEISTDFAPLVPQSNTERCPKRRDVVKIGEKSSEERECVILGRAGKASGRNKFWLNQNLCRPLALPALSRMAHSHSFDDFSLILTTSPRFRHRSVLDRGTRGAKSVDISTSDFCGW